jgi:PKD repeat protein
MKKILLHVCLTFGLSPFVLAQQGEWTWMTGSSNAGAPGIFGTIQVPAPNNTPPALYGPATWVDTIGNLWLFAGGFDGYNAVWRYGISTNEWTWIKGDSIPAQVGVYGTMGIPASGNTPGGRAFGFPSWNDLNGDFWIYAGFGTGASAAGPLADLWKYSMATNEWTWMNGSDTPYVAPVYGLLQVPAPGNTPGSRLETTANWVDSSGNLWFFGGWDYNLQPKNDIWKYDITLNQWTWMGGSTTNSIPFYGTMGTPSPTNTPGGRNAYCVFKDKDENFWLFGGFISGTKRNDLWKLDPATVEWTWISGTNQLNANGNAGIQCVADNGYYPEARGENRACWTDSCGNFWLFGGSSFNGNLNDLWVYRPDSNDWTYSGGSLSINDTGIYGTQGISDPANKPEGRNGTTGWYDHSGNIWLFGGLGGGEHNDLWRFVPDPDCPLSGCTNPPSSAFSASETADCEKVCVTFFDSSANNPSSWEWLFPGGAPASSTDQNPTNICYNTPGTYDVTLITTNANGNDTLTLPNYITVYPTPPIPTITQNGNVLTCSPAASYQWQLNSVDIPGATMQSYTYTQTGLYTVFTADSNGCSNSASLLITGVTELGNDYSISVFPNPGSGSFTVELHGGFIDGEIAIEVVNILGQKVFSSTEIMSSGNRKMQIDLTNVTGGVYFIEIKIDQEFERKKILIAD